MNKAVGKQKTRDHDLELLYRALAEPIGLLLTTNSIPGAEGRLNAARKSDPALRGIQILKPLGLEGELALVKGRVEKKERKEWPGLPDLSDFM